MNFIVDKAKANKKWSPVLENLGIVDSTKKEWMAEYAEMHQLNENVAYSTLGNLNGMGAIQAPANGASQAPGQLWGAGSSTPGSGDIAQNLLPVSMKIAAQTIGLDLVAVKPSSSPRIELLFVDFKYDNNDQSNDQDERPLVFKVNDANIAAVITALKAEATVVGATEVVGGYNKQMFVAIAGGTLPTGTTQAIPTNKQGVLEFLGFSRVDGYPMFRAFRQANNAAAGNWTFDQTKNTFGTTGSVADALNLSGISALVVASAGTFTELTSCSIELVSTMEDHLPGFVAGWNISQPMRREVDEKTYPGVIGPDVFTKSVIVGDIEITSALKRTQIEDIKASTGMDIVQKLESVLINELTQTISKQIVAKITTLAEENRISPTTPKTGGVSKFDFNVDAYTALGGAAPGGETYHSIQRKLVAKINNASNFIATDGRVGPAQYIVTNGNIASVLQDVAGYTINPVNAGKLNTNGQLYPMGNIGNIAIYVDPYMKWDDNRIFLGRKNTVEQPGLIFVPYLMAQSISLISEATWAPRMMIRSRYAITDIGFFPHKQFMAITVTDTNGVLI
ncbi:hypothetical protein M0Q50_02990 [bacterium]|jgi:hypothetical protein|nr:hypothetical protein [bacterium]